MGSLGMAEVPDLRGLTVAEAIGAARGFELRDPEGAPVSAERGLGVIVRQAPQPGRYSPGGAGITVWTSGGGDDGVREPCLPYPPVLDNRAYLEVDDDLDGEPVACPIS
ncbi:MAG: PASTA domain-containing protein [Sciscionella sp.]